MADLVQALDPSVASGTLRDQQHPDRFDVAVRGLRDPRRTPRQRRTRRFDRVDRVGLPRPPAQLTVRPVDLDHLERTAPQITGQTRAVRAGAFDTHPAERAERRQPRTQLVIARRRRRERAHTQHAATRVHRRRDVHVQMSIDSARHQARGLYDGHRHPFSLKRSRGGTHVPGRRP